MSLDGLILHATEDGCTLSVKVHPGARRNAVTGVLDGSLKISLTTPPTDGRANAALIALLVELLDIPRSPDSVAPGSGQPLQNAAHSTSRPGARLCSPQRRTLQPASLGETYLYSEPVRTEPRRRKSRTTPASVAGVSESAARSLCGVPSSSNAA